MGIHVYNAQYHTPC